MGDMERETDSRDCPTCTSTHLHYAGLASPLTMEDSDEAHGSTGVCTVARCIEWSKCMVDMGENQDRPSIRAANGVLQTEHVESNADQPVGLQWLIDRAELCRSVGQMIDSFTHLTDSTASIIRPYSKYHRVA